MKESLKIAGQCKKPSRLIGRFYSKNGISFGSEEQYKKPS